MTEQSLEEGEIRVVRLDHQRDKRESEHRSTEPRVFALLWSVYLLAAAMLTIFATPMLGISSAGAYMPASRSLLALMAVGAVLLWPMVRLSQAPPTEPVRSALTDLLVVALLAQAVIWPLSVLPGGALLPPFPWPGLWPWEVAAGLGLMFTGWSALVGAIIARGTSKPVGLARTGWMILCVGLALFAPALALTGHSLGLPINEAWWLGSPISAGYALTSAPSGHAPTMDRAEWIASATPTIGALVAWLGPGMLLARRNARGAPRFSMR